MTSSDSSDSTIFHGIAFAFLGGPLGAHPRAAVRARLLALGASVDAEPIAGRTRYLLAAHAVSDAIESPNRLQFLPDARLIRRRVAFALAHLDAGLVVVDVAFLDRCVAAARHLPPLPSERIAAIDRLRARRRDLAADALARGPPDSALEPRLQRLVRLLFDEEQLRRTLLDMAVDPDRVAGLDALAPAAFALLAEIERLLTAAASTVSDDVRDATLRSLSHSYYDLVPHTDRAPILSLDALKQRTLVLESLSAISAGDALLDNPLASANTAADDDGDDDARTLTALNCGTALTHDPLDATAAAAAATTNALDINYRKLRCRLTPLEPCSAEFDTIRRYMRATFARQHRPLFRAHLVDAFEVERDGELERFAAHGAPRGNLHLLWHGSRLANFRGILAQGLRIAPPEAPVSGYFLGKGVYLADVFSKSCEYCHATRDRPEALLLLCEAALGNVYNTAHGKLIDADMLDEAGYSSVRGMGTREPRAAYAERHDGVTVPLGKESSAPCKASELDHNEFIVYNTAQVRMKYAVMVRFEFPPFDDAELVDDDDVAPDHDSENEDQ
jgi:hypothetical protein